MHAWRQWLTHTDDSPGIKNRCTWYNHLWSNVHVIHVKPPYTEVVAYKSRDDCWLAGKHNMCMSGFGLLSWFCAEYQAHDIMCKGVHMIWFHELFKQITIFTAQSTLTRKWCRLQSRFDMLEASCRPTSRVSLCRSATSTRNKVAPWWPSTHKSLTLECSGLHRMCQLWVSLVMHKRSSLHVHAMSYAQWRQSVCSSKSSWRWLRWVQQ